MVSVQKGLDNIWSWHEKTKTRKQEEFDKGALRVSLGSVKDYSSEGHSLGAIEGFSSNIDYTKDIDKGV